MRLPALLRRCVAPVAPAWPVYDMSRPSGLPGGEAWPEHPLVLDQRLRAAALAGEAAVIRADAEVVRADNERAALLRGRDVAEQGHGEDMSAARVGARHDAELVELQHRADRRSLIRELRGGSAEVVGEAPGRHAAEPDGPPVSGAGPDPDSEIVRKAVDLRTHPDRPAGPPSAKWVRKVTGHGHPTAARIAAEITRTEADTTNEEAVPPT